MIKRKRKMMIKRKRKMMTKRKINMMTKRKINMMTKRKGKVIEEIEIAKVISMNCRLHKIAKIINFTFKTNIIVRP